MKRAHEESSAADPDAAVAAPGDAHAVRERLLQMEAEFRGERKQQQQAAVAAAEFAAEQTRERGAGDWANYQPPPAVLQAVQQRAVQQAVQQAVHVVQQPGGAAAAAPAAPAPAQGAAKELPPALRARLAARGILPKGGGGPAAASPAGGAAPLPHGWYEAMDTVHGRAYFYCPATGERSWTRPHPAVSAVCRCRMRHGMAWLPPPPSPPLLAAVLTSAPCRRPCSCRWAGQKAGTLKPAPLIITATTRVSGCVA